MAYSYRWQYCDIDFLRHCLKQYSLLLEKIPSAILTEEATGTQMFVTGYLSDCIKRCDDGFDDYTMTALLPEGTASVTLQGNGWTIRRLSTRYHGKYAALLPEIAAYYFSKAGRQRRRDTEQALGIFRLCVQQNVGNAVSPARFSLGGRRNSLCQSFENALRRCRPD